MYNQTTVVTTKQPKLKPNLLEVTFLKVIIIFFFHFIDRLTSNQICQESKFKREVY